MGVATPLTDSGIALSVAMARPAIGAGLDAHARGECRCVEFQFEVLGHGVEVRSQGLDKRPLDRPGRGDGLY